VIWLEGTEIRIGLSAAEGSERSHASIMPSTAAEGRFIDLIMLSLRS
jgi:hypothetical protein